MWDILRHENDQYVSFIKDVTYNNEASDEVSSFVMTTVLRQPQKFQTSPAAHRFEIISKQIGNPYMSGDIVTQEEISPFDTEYLLYYLSFGKKLFRDFNHERLELKIISQH